MFELLTDELRVQVLDPVADRALTGVRYCTGGYVFQVHDARLGPLMSGPTYPDDFNWFDGQGIPDAFALAPVPGPAPLALVLGVGVCDLAADVVVEPCTWDVTAGAGADERALTFRTAHAFAGVSCTLERTVTLVGRVLTSTTSVVNRSDERALPVVWFPHPFFPQPSDDELFRTGTPVRTAPNDGFEAVHGGAVLRRRVLPEGHVGPYLELEHAADGPLRLEHRHDLLGSVTMTTTYAPGRFAVWGNHHTVSPEPFLERTLAAGADLAWSVTYTF